MEAVGIRSLLKPQYIYSCVSETDNILRTNLFSGEPTWHQIPGYQFKIDCRWSELPGGSLLITGGPAAREVVKIDTLRE
jgi:hypothetical protein